MRRRKNRTLWNDKFNNSFRFTCDLLAIKAGMSLQEATTRWWILIPVRHEIDQRSHRVLVEEAIDSRNEDPRYFGIDSFLVVVDHSWGSGRNHAADGSVESAEACECSVNGSNADSRLEMFQMQVSVGKCSQLASANNANIIASHVDSSVPRNRNRNHPIDHVRCRRVVSNNKHSVDWDIEVDEQAGESNVEEVNPQVSLASHVSISHDEVNTKTKALSFLQWIVESLLNAHPVNSELESITTANSSIRHGSIGAIPLNETNAELQFSKASSSPLPVRPAAWEVHSLIVNEIDKVLVDAGRRVVSSFCEAR